MAEEMMMQESMTLNDAMGQDNAQALMQPDDEIRVIIMSRMEMLSPQELQKLDQMIDGESARILLKILPELEDVIGMIANQTQAPQQAGALAAM